MITPEASISGSRAGQESLLGNYGIFGRVLKLKIIHIQLMTHRFKRDRILLKRVQIIIETFPRG